MNFWYDLIYELYLIFMSIQVFDVNISLSESEAAHMHTKSKYPWLRHIDFLIVDIVSLLTAFTVAFVLHFKGLVGLQRQVKYRVPRKARAGVLLHQALFDAA